MDIKKTIKWFEDNLNLCARILSVLIGLFIVFSRSNLQIVAVIAFIIAIVGVDPIKEYIEIAIEKFRRSKKGNLFAGGYDASDSPPSSSEVPQTFGNRNRRNKEEEFHRLVAAAMQYYNTNQFDLAAQCAEDALEIKSNDINLRNWLSSIYGERIGNKNQAIAHSKKVLTNDPKNIFAMFNLAIYTNHLKKSDASLPIYLEVEKLIKEQNIPEDSEINAKFNLFIGHDYRWKKDKDISEARARYEKAISLFEQRIKDGDKTGVSEYWLNDAQKNLSKLENENT